MIELELNKVTLKYYIVKIIIQQLWITYKQTIASYKIL